MLRGGAVKGMLEQYKLAGDRMHSYFVIVHGQNGDILHGGSR